jgi:hypothetical protein
MDYQKSINALIPLAEKEANKRVSELGRKTEERIGVGNQIFNWDFFTEYFHEAMNRMAKEAGIR